MQVNYLLIIDRKTVKSAVNTDDKRLKIKK